MTKRKDGLWQQQMTVYENGKKKQKFFYGKTKQEILKKIATYKEESEHGAFFETVADEWWEQHEPTLSPTSVPSYIRGKNRASDYFKSERISKIRPVDIERFMDYIITENHMAKKTAENQLIVIKQIFKFAIRSGYIDNNPSRDITVGKKLKKTVREIPSNSDILKIKNSIECTFGLFAYFAMYTGLRKGELLALTWEDINFKEKNITINKAVYNSHNRPIIKEPKTSAGIRIVPLLNKLNEVLTPSTGVIFNIGGEMLKEKQFRTLWDTYKKESGVSCTVHQLRHLYTTMLFENDIDIKDAQKLLGHAQSSTTQDIYTHIRTIREQRIKEKLLTIDIE